MLALLALPGEPQVNAFPGDEPRPTRPAPTRTPAADLAAAQPDGRWLTPKTWPWIREFSGTCPLVGGYGWRGALTWPVDSRYVRQSRLFSDSHTGIDIDTPNGSAVRAMAGGVVVWAGLDGYGFGNLVVLAHGGGLQTFYAHLSAVNVECGQYVASGQQIGASGQTGLSTFPALHIEVRRGDGRESADPLRWMGLSYDRVPLSDNGPGLAAGGSDAAGGYTRQSSRPSRHFARSQTAK